MNDSVDQHASGSGQKSNVGGSGQPPDANTQNEECAVRSIRVQFPALQTQNIELWFIQLDHWFSANGIKSENTKFSTVVASLNGALLQQVYESVINPPEHDRYKALKAAIIANFADSEQKRVQQLVSGLQLGDRKPSHLLGDLRRVGGPNQEDALLRGLWMQRLPLQVRTCLSTVGAELPIAKLAEIADTVMETFRVADTDHVFAVNAPNPSADCSGKRLSEEIKELTRLVSQLVSSRGRSQSISTSYRGQSRSNSRPARDATPAQDSGECWYHKKFKADATKCKKPCIWPQKN